MPQIHPDPILYPSVVKNVLVDPDLRFPIFSFPKFHLFRPCLGRFLVFLVFFVAMPWRVKMLGSILRLLCLLWPRLGRGGEPTRT